MTDSIEQFLYQVASLLYLPVIVGCALLVLYMPLIVGMVLREAWMRRHGQRSPLAAHAAGLEELRVLPASMRELETERLLQAAEAASAQRLDRVRFVIRAGPALGLMGTLIPMGISLAALAGGDIPKMAGSMVTAFTATVAGLGSGVVAYLVALARERWEREDLAALAYAADRAILGLSLDEARQEGGNEPARAPA